MKLSLHLLLLMVMMVIQLIFFRPTSSISAAAVEALITGIEVASEKANSIYQSLSTTSSITPEAIVFAYLESIPVIGTIVQIFNDNKIDTQKLILSKLDSLSKQQENAMKLIETLEKKIDFIVTNNQITQSTSYISSCSVERINFLRNPDKKPEQDRLVTCYDNIMKDIRLLVRILSEKENTLPKFFQDIIKREGFCNGNKIVNSYKYLFSNVVGGCETAIIAEQLKYNGTSELLLQECKAHIKDITDHLKTIFRGCTADSCETIQKTLTGIIQYSSDRDADYLLKDISDTFPWFTFSLLTFTADPLLQIIGNLLPSATTFCTTGFYTCVLWTPYNTTSGKWDSSVTGFSMQFSPEHFVKATIAMNVSKNLNSNPAFIMSNVEKDNTLSYKACPYSKIQLPDSQPPASRDDIIVAYRSLLLITILLVLFIQYTE